MDPANLNPADLRERQGTLEMRAYQKPPQRSLYFTMPNGDPPFAC